MINTRDEYERIGSINRFNKLVLFYFFLVTSIATLANIRIVYWSSVVLATMALIILILTSEVKTNKYIYWIFLFDFIVIASSFWAYDLDYAMDGIKSVLTVSIIFSFISMLIKNEKNFYEILRLFVFSRIITVFYILFHIDASTLGVIRIGAESLGEEWNANNIGMNMALSAFMAFILFNIKQNKFIKTMYIVMMFLLGLITALTGSRKAIFVLLFTISIYILLNSEKKKLSRIIIILLSGLTIFYVIMNIPFFYDVLGVRILSLLAVFTGQGRVDRSTLMRFDMIEYGKKLFAKKPILGYGINNYRALYGNMTGWYTYSHNNYIELLVGIGLVGTILYYSGYFYIIKNTIFEKNSLLKICSIFIMTIMIIEIGLVSYNSFYVHLMICLSFSAISLTEKEKVKDG